MKLTDTEMNQLRSSLICFCGEVCGDRNRLNKLVNPLCLNALLWSLLTVCHNYSHVLNSLSGAVTLLGEVTLSKMFCFTCKKGKRKKLLPLRVDTFSKGDWCT